MSRPRITKKQESHLNPSLTESSPAQSRACAPVHTTCLREGEELPSSHEPGALMGAAEICSFSRGLACTELLGPLEPNKHL